MSAWNWTPATQDCPPVNPSVEPPGQSTETGAIMGNPTDEERIQVNIKLVPKSDWEKGRSLSARHGEPMGSTVGRALRQMYERDTGPRELPPINALVPQVNALAAPEPLRAISDNPTEESGNPRVPGKHETIAFLAQIVATTGDRIADVPGLRTLAAELVREARGLPPLPPRKRAERRVAIGNGVDNTHESPTQAR